MVAAGRPPDGPGTPRTAARAVSGSGLRPVELFRGRDRGPVKGVIGAVLADLAGGVARGWRQRGGFVGVRLRSVRFLCAGGLVLVGEQAHLDLQACGPAGGQFAVTRTREGSVAAGLS